MAGAETGSAGDDTATTFAPDINVASVSPYSTTFNNSANNYTLSGTGGFGIASGTLTKNGTATVTISSVNSYAGATTINAGTILMSGSGTLGTGSALTLGGGKLDLGTTSQTLAGLTVPDLLAASYTLAGTGLTLNGAADRQFGPGGAVTNAHSITMDF